MATEETSDAKAEVIKTMVALIKELEDAGLMTVDLFN